jgi:hypothetical protein
LGQHYNVYIVLTGLYRSRPPGQGRQFIHRLTLSL